MDEGRREEKRREEKRREEKGGGIGELVKERDGAENMSERGKDDLMHGDDMCGVGARECQWVPVIASGCTGYLEGGLRTTVAASGGQWKSAEVSGGQRRPVEDSGMLLGMAVPLTIGDVTVCDLDCVAGCRSDPIP